MNFHGIGLSGFPGLCGWIGDYFYVTGCVRGIGRRSPWSWRKLVVLPGGSDLLYYRPAHAGRLAFRPADGIGGLRERIGLKGIPGALALGLVSGLVASQCATPVLAAILTYVMAEGASGLWCDLVVVYALGRGLPVVLAGTFTGALKRLQSLGRWSL